MSAVITKQNALDKAFTSKGNRSRTINQPTMNSINNSNQEPKITLPNAPNNSNTPTSMKT